MNFKSIKFVFILLIVLQSSLLCSSQNFRKLSRKGSVEDKTFNTTFKYEPYGNAIIVKVLIKNKEYRLQFDTGTVTVISPNMMKELNLDALGKEEVGDLGSTVRELNFVKIDTINFNGINFFNTVAVVLDIEAAKDFKCSGIDGFLGANFMRSAVWEIDMNKQEITFTNSIDSINIPENTPYTKTFIGYDGTPAVTSFLGKEKLYNTNIDYGYPGGISLFSYEFRKLIDKNPNIKYLKTNGSAIGGVYGDIKTSESYIAIIDNFRTGKLNVPNNLISFGQLGLRTIGAGFLKNYRVVLSWKDRKAWFIENNVAEKKIIIKTNGYGIRLEDKSIFISSISENSDAQQKGLKIGDKVLRVGNFDYTNVTDEKWCEIISGASRPDKQILLIERNGEELTVVLERKVLLEN